MKLSEVASILVSLCWNNDTPMATGFTIGLTYEYKGKKYKTTEDTYKEIIEYQQVAEKPIDVKKYGKSVKMRGIKIK